MATIKTIDVKGWMFQGKPDYSMEISIEYDWQPLTPDQNDAIVLQAEQLKGIIENQLMTWSRGPSGEFKPADQLAPKSVDKATVRHAEVKDGEIVETAMCAVCHATCEKRTGRTGKSYMYCPNCKQNRKMTGEPFEPEAKQ